MRRRLLGTTGRNRYAMHEWMTCFFSLAVEIDVVEDMGIKESVANGMVT
ncbi:MAG: hypothetical protein AB8B50_21230 [Pirellulaceae bacterium]